MKCYGVVRTDQDGWMEEARHRVGVREKMRDKMGRKVLKRFGHVELRSGERMTKRV